MTDGYRERLLAGMVEAIAAVGYADLTIADVVRAARVSKRTFYEHFETKEGCFLAVYEAESSRLIAEIERAIREVPAGEQRIAVGIAVYLASIAQSPRLARTLLIEILHTGAPGLAIRRAVMRRFAGLFVSQFRALGKRTALSPEVAMAIVGGINELVLEASEDDRLDRLGELGGAIAELVDGVLRAPPRRR